MDCGDEYDRSLLEARVVPQHAGELEAVELGHADIDEHHRHIILEQKRQGLLRGVGLDEVFSQPGQDDLVAQQLGRLIVDQQDVDPIQRHYSKAFPQRCSHMRSAAKSCSVLTGLAR